MAALAAFLVTLALGVGSTVLGAQRGASVPGVVAWVPTEILFVLNSVGFAAAAVLVAWKRPRNRMWVVMSAAGVAGVVFGFSTEWAIFDLLRQHGSLPGGELAAWLGTWTFQPIPTSLALVLFLFPTGQPVSRRWSAVLWLLPLYVLTGWVATALLPTWPYNVHAGNTGPIHNPLALHGAEAVLATLNNAGTVVLATALVAAIGSLVARYRRASSLERQQLKIFLFAACFVPLGFLLWPVYAGNAAFTSPFGVVALVIAAVAVVGVPVAIAVAVLRYRLYDIDIVISRTIVYGSLAAFITAVYVGIAVGIGTLVGSGGKPNLGLSILATAIVALGFQPVRERLQRVANRLVYGERATPYEALSQFSQRAADSYSLAEVLPRMARVLGEGTGAERADVWLRSADALLPEASWPEDAAHLDSVSVLNGDSSPAFLGASRVCEVSYRGEALGALSVQKRRGESLTPVEDKLIEDLARQAGLVLKNVRLTAELQQKLEELRVSRQRLVVAQDEERRRLERNLHDGAQQYLVAIKVKLGLAETLAARNPDQARNTIAELKGDTDDALQTLRDLARGIYPPLLADKGLVAALEAQARKATLPVSVHGDGVGRYPQDVESTVYFCVLEATQNAQKYAHASRVDVTITASDDALVFTVADDGCGFDPAVVVRGAGLTNMTDRLDVLGGSLELDSKPGHGTNIVARIPIDAGARLLTAEVAPQSDASMLASTSSTRMRSIAGG